MDTLQKVSKHQQAQCLNVLVDQKPWIRLVQKKDLKQLVDLCKQHAFFEKTAYHSNGKRQLLEKTLFSSNGFIKCWVVEQDNRLVGYTTVIRQFATWDANYYLYMDCLFVEEKFRHAGIGISLMNVIKKYAIKEQLELQWQTPEFNHHAIKFYKKIGAESKSKMRFFWKVN